MPMIDSVLAASATAVSKSFSAGVIALQNIDFKLYFGEVTAIVGANGSGKSTLLRIFCGLIKQDSGEVQVLNQDPMNRSKTFRSQTCYVAQDSALDPEMTGRETLNFFAALYEMPKRHWKGRFTHLTKEFGLKEHLDRRVRHYSGGLRKRLHLALGLIHDPRLIIVDEPTAGLDPRGCDFFWSFMRSRADQGCSVLVVSHDMDHVERYSDRVALLDKGSLLLCDTPSKIISSHGSSVLQLTLKASVKDENIHQELSKITGVKRIHIVDKQIMISVEKEKIDEPCILNILKRYSLEPSVVQSKSADILSAYFNLTGYEVTTKRVRERK